MDSPVISRNRPDHLFGIIRAAVIHKNNFVVDVEFREGLFQAFVHYRDRLTILVTGDYGGDAMFRIQTETLRRLKILFLIFYPLEPLGRLDDPFAEANSWNPPDARSHFVDVGVPVGYIPISIGHGEIGVMGN